MASYQKSVQASALLLGIVTTVQRKDCWTQTNPCWATEPLSLYQGKQAVALQWQPGAVAAGAYLLEKAKWQCSSGAVAGPLL